MPSKPNTGLKTVVVLLWLLVVLAVLGAGVLLVSQGIVAFVPATQAAPVLVPSPSSLPPQVPTDTPFAPPTDTPPAPAPTVSPATVAPTFPPASPTLPPVPSGTPFQPRTQALLFVGADGCSVQAYSPADGSTATLTARTPASGCDQPQLSPDGSRLAFLMTGSYYTLYDMNIDGSGVTRLSQGRVFGYAWSPDGRRLVYAAYITAQGAYGLYFVNADGSSPTISSYPGISITPTTVHLAWSPDGQWIYAPVDDPSGADQSLPFALNANGTDAVPMSAKGVDPKAWVAWSPDSRSVSTLIFGYDYGYSVSLLDFLGLDNQPIPSLYYDDPTVQSNTFAPEGKFVAVPFWSPDGRRALLSGASSLVSGEYQLLLMDSATRAISLLANLDQAADLAAWSPGGERIAFLEYPGGPNGPVNLGVIQADGSGLTTVAQGVTESQPVWIQK